MRRESAITQEMVDCWCGPDGYVDLNGSLHYSHLTYQFVGGVLIRSNNGVPDGWATMAWSDTDWKVPTSREWRPYFQDDMATCPNIIHPMPDPEFDLEEIEIAEKLMELSEAAEQVILQMG